MESQTNHTRGRRVRRILLIILAALIVLCAVIVGMCLVVQRKAVTPLDAYRMQFPGTVIDVADDGAVTITPKDGSVRLGTGILFYTGAQITPDAYIPLLARLSEAGYDCYIPKLTCNMASLERNAADAVIDTHPEIRHWYLAGHSMGGLTASGYVTDHADTVDGLILLAAYTNRDMSGLSLPVLSIYGDADGVMNGKLYEKRLTWYPADFEEHVVEGANHAQYGDYGEQPRDNEAHITAEQQQRETARIMGDWLTRHETTADEEK